MSSKSVCRVVSLLPSATELLSVLVTKIAQQQQASSEHAPTVQLVGRSHECDEPKTFVQGVPMLTASRLAHAGVNHSSNEIDQQVRQALDQGLSLYHLDQSTLTELAPDVILTQSLCGVCSIETTRVMEAVEKMKHNESTCPRIVSLNPKTLDDILESLSTVGESVGLGDAAQVAKEEYQSRIESVKQRVEERKSLARPNVAFLEWTDPLFIGGHWTPELIHLAGGRHPLNNTAGSNSFVVSEDDVVKSDPDLIVISPCGFNLEQTRRAVKEDLETKSWWHSLEAVQKGNVVLVDGNLHFNRPSTRLIDSLEWLCWLFDNISHGTPLTENFKAAFNTDYQWEIYVPSNSKPIQNRSGKNRRKQIDYGDQLPVEVEEAHKLAMNKGELMYEDPFSGLYVFTEFAALQRGYCCGKKCRHCPYGHFNVPPEKRTKSLKRPTLLDTGKTTRLNCIRSTPHVDILFWSGGKDSLLALSQRISDIKETEPRDSCEIVLLTTFDEETNIIPEQNIPIHSVFDQAKALRLDLMTVPLPAMSSNDVYVRTLENAIKEVEEAYGCPRQSSRLIFGDIHLEDIKKWREASFSKYQLSFPLFGKPFEDLKRHLKALIDEASTSNIGANKLEIRISNVTSDLVKNSGISPGDTLNSELCSSLERLEGVDFFGENGEFHTYVEFQR